MMEKVNIVNATLWSSIERFSIQGIQLLLGIVIARLVLPSDYGLIALLGFFLSLAQTFVDSGFLNALIHKENRTEVDFSTVFYFNLFVSLLLYTLLFIGADFISVFYAEPKLVLLTRFIGLNVIISALAIVQVAKLSIELNFKTQAKISLISVIISGIVGLVLAYNGYGVWALVTQSLMNNILNTGLLWITSRWLPTLIFSWDSFKELFAFGSKLLVTGLMHSIYTNMYTVIIGKRYSITDLGYYNRANTFSFLPSDTIRNIVYRVLYPVQCGSQNDNDKLLSIFFKSVKLSSFVVFPLMTVICVLSEPFICIVLTDKWILSSKLLSILCFAYMWIPMISLNETLIMVKGRTSLYLKKEIVCKVIGVIILLATLQFDVEVLCWGIVFTNIMNYILNFFFVKRVISYDMTKQIKIVVKALLSSLIVGVVVCYSVSFLDSNLFKLIVGTLIGLTLYLIIAMKFHKEEVAFFKDIWMRYMKKQGK